MKKFLLLSIFLHIFCLSVNSQESKRSYTATRVSSPPRIDGVDDDEAWQNIRATGQFTQRDPDFGVPPSQMTEVKVAYDDFALYITATMFDSHPDSILKELGKRDDELNADYFFIGIDTYNKRLDSYYFGLSASGVQSDQMDSDEEYNAVWESAVKIHERGWTAEVKIPYSAIRFPNSSVQTWGIQFERMVRRRREQSQWSLIPKEAAEPLNYIGVLNGIENIKSPLRLSFSPFAAVYLERIPQYHEDGTVFSESQFAFTGGADVKYGIDDRFTIDMTLLPDFGQVQSDKKVKNLSYQEITYDENRPFFKEAFDLFDKNRLFYSRRIGRVPEGFYSVFNQLDEGDVLEDNPAVAKLLNATKFSGRTNNGLGLGLFNAVTDNTYATVRDSSGNARKILTEPFSNYNIIAFEQYMENNSSVYFMNSNVTRSRMQQDANVTGTGMELSNKKNTMVVEAEGAMSNKYGREENGHSKKTGFMYSIGLRKTGGTFEYGVRNSLLDDTYDSRDAGYYVLNNFIHNSAFFNHRMFKPTKLLRNSFNSLSVSYSNSYVEGKRTSFNIGINSFSTFHNYLSMFAGAGFNPLPSVDYYEARLPGWIYRSSESYYVYGGISSDYRKRIALDLNLSHFSYFKNNHSGFPVLPGYGGESGLRFRASDRLTLRYDAGYTYEPYNVGFAGITGTYYPVPLFGSRRIDTWSNSLSAKFIFKNDMSLTVFGRHYRSAGIYMDFFRPDGNGDLQESPAPVSSFDYNYNAFNIDVVYSWQFAPGSTLNIIYKTELENEDDAPETGFSENFRNTLETPQVQNVSIKLLYYLDYLYLKKLKKK